MGGVGGFPVSAYWNLLGTYKIVEKSITQEILKRQVMSKYIYGITKKF